MLRAPVSALADYSSSPNLSEISAVTACMAAASSLPLVSTMMCEPLPAASIMTPMMLLALTRRPLRLTQTSLLNWPATWVSFALARACSPSLLIISTSCCGMMQGERRQAHHAFATATYGFGHHDVQGLVAVGQCANQHRQADAGDAL